MDGQEVQVLWWPLRLCLTNTFNLENLVAVNINAYIINRIDELTSPGLTVATGGISGLYGSDILYQREPIYNMLTHCQRL